MTMVLSSTPMSLSFFITVADDVVELGHAGFLNGPAVLRVAHRFILRREVRDDVHARRVEPDEERLVVGLGLVHELEREVEDFVVHRLHPLGIERAGVLDLLFADLAPARHHGRVILIRRPGVDHVARADFVQQLLRVAGVRGVLHRVEVIEVAEELVEPVDGGQELIEIAEVVLAELARGITHGLERRGNGASLCGHARCLAPAWPTVVMPVRIGNSPVMKAARPAVQLASA